MGTLINSEDPDEMLHYVTFHQYQHRSMDVDEGSDQILNV